MCNDMRPSHQEIMHSIDVTVNNYNEINVLYIYFNELLACWAECSDSKVEFENRIYAPENPYFDK